MQFVSDDLLHCVRMPDYFFFDGGEFKLKYGAVLGMRFDSITNE
jgi:hypothetical protein